MSLGGIISGKSLHEDPSVNLNNQADAKAMVKLPNETSRPTNFSKSHLIKYFGSLTWQKLQFVTFKRKKMLPASPLG